MVLVEFLSMLIKTLLTSSNIWGKFEKLRQENKKVRGIAISIIAAFILFELGIFFYNHNENREVINEYEAGYSYELQELNNDINKLVDDYKKESTMNSILTSIGFSVAVLVISIIFRSKKLTKHRLKYILCGTTLMLYIGAVIVPMSFSTGKNCSFSVEPIYRVKNKPTYFYQDDKIVGVKNNQELTTAYEYTIELSEKREFDLYKMGLQIAEITSALALLFVVKRASEQNKVLAIDYKQPDDSQDESKG